MWQSRAGLLQIVLLVLQPCFARRKRSVIIGTGAYEREETINTQLSILTEINSGVSSNLSLSGLSFTPVIFILLPEVVFLLLFHQLWTV